MSHDAPAATPMTALPAATAPPRRRTSRPRVELGRIPRPRDGLALTTLGTVAMAVIAITTLGMVVTASHGPSILVPRSGIVFPSWDAGPLHDLLPAPFTGPQTLSRALSITLGGLFLAYLAVVVSARALSLRAIALVVVLLHVIIVLGPPMQLNDVFNYLGYARLGALHGLNPYSHVISDESLDPVFRFASWDGLRSPYGQLFTMLTYPLGLLPLSLASWILKAVTVALSLTFLWLVALCARALDRDPRFVLAFVAFNPIYIVYELGAFHNDFFMLVPSMAAILWTLRGRDRSAGAALMVAAAVKFTAIVIGPFLLVALATRRRCGRFVLGALIALVPLGVAILAVMGTALPNVSQQSTLLSIFSVPNLVGLPFGVGGSALILHLASLLVILVAVYHLVRRRDHWLAGAGWTTLALILSLSWSVPWYVVWVLPLAALSRRPALRVAALALTIFLMFAFSPVVNNYVAAHHIKLFNTPAGRASRSLQSRLAN